MMKEVWVEFIGLGYEVTKMAKVSASSFKDAHAKAEAWYKETKQTFPYIGTEIKDARFIEF